LVEDQAFSPSYDLAPRPPPPSFSRQQARLATHMKTNKERQLADVRGGRGEGRSQILRRQESLSSIYHWIFSAQKFTSLNTYNKVGPLEKWTRDQNFQST
jgi:hypothetical protein